MAPLEKRDLLRVLTSFADDYLTKADIVQPDDNPSSVEAILSSWKEKRKLGFNLTLQVVFAAYVDLLEDSCVVDKKSQYQQVKHVLDILCNFYNINFLNFDSKKNVILILIKSNDLVLLRPSLNFAIEIV